MITWEEKVAFVGMSIESMTPDRCYPFKIKLSYNPGASSIGHGFTLEEAICDAATSVRICWSSVEKKITEKRWMEIAHT